MALTFGFGIADITPDHPTHLFGFAPRRGKSTGAHEPLQARCLLLAAGGKRIALVALDLGGVPAELDAMLAGRLPEDVEVIACATHTHSGPQVLSHVWYAPVSPDYLRHLADRVAECIRTAISAAVHHAEIALVRAPTRGIAHNRREADGPVDHDATVLALVWEGAISALWVNFPCHPVTIGQHNTQFSADFPGYARAMLEERLGVPVLYTTGCAGQINLGHKPSDSIRGLNQHLRSREQAEKIGHALAEAILVRLDAGLGTPQPVEQLRYRHLSWPACYAVPDTTACDRLRQQADAVLADAQSYLGDRTTAEIDLSWLETPHWGGSHHVGVLEIGAINCVFLSDEIFVETALALPADICVSYAYSNLGYVIPADKEGEGGYEVEAAWRVYGAPGPFAPGTGRRMQEAARMLLEEMQAMPGNPA